MKTIKVMGLALAFLTIIPVQVSAITQEQAVSLINVVRSSPETPASAFTPLITAFSTVTVQQANTLIVLVQAAPNAPAEAFVNLLTAFAPDPVVTQPVSEPVVQPVQSTPIVGSQEPVVVLPQVEKKLTLSDSQGCTVTFCELVASYYEDGKEVITDLTFSAELGMFSSNDMPELKNPFTRSNKYGSPYSKINDQTIRYHLQTDQPSGSIITRSITVSANGASLTKVIKFAVK